MRRTARVLLAACFAALLVEGLPATPVAQQPSPPQVFRGGTDAVLVDVYPHRNGRIVENLKTEDFQVFEDGRPQRIDSFEFVRLDPATLNPRTDPNTVAEMRAIAADPHNRVFVVYLDNGHTTVEGGLFIRQPLVNMLERAVGPTDLFGVMTPSMNPTQLALGRLTTSIDEQLGRYWTWGRRQRLTTDNTDPMEEQLWSCFHIRQPTEKGELEDWLVKDGPVIRFLDDIIIERRREDRVLDNLESLVDYLGNLREARSVVVAVTDGWVLFDRNPALTNEPQRDRRFAAIVPSGDRRNIARAGLDTEFAECVQELNRLATHDGGLRFRQLVALANRNNVSFYPVASGGLMTQDAAITDPVRRSPGALPTDVGARDASRLSARVNNNRSLAESTDGLAVVDTNDLGAGLRRVGDDVSAYYLLTYVSDKTARDNRYRKIEVRVKGDGLSVRARRGYVAREAADVKAPASAPPLAAGIGEALGRLGAVRSAADVVAYGAVMGPEVRVAVELGNTSTRWPEGTLVTATVSAEAGAATTASEAPLDTAWRNAWLSFPVPNTPGPWRVILNVGTGRDRLQEQVVVARSTGTILGDPIVSRARAAARSPLRPAATLRLARTERVHVEWMVKGTVDTREARLLDAKGQPLAVPVSVSDIAQPAALAADLVLNPLAPGSYVIELSTTSGTTTTRHYVAFMVTP